MTDQKTRSAIALAALDRMVEAAKDDPLKLAALANMAQANGDASKAYDLARRAVDLAPDQPEVLSLANAPLSASVPKWHFGIVKDEARNEAYEAALRRAVGRPGARVLDIGAGTGLLAMMAARAGAETVVTCEVNPSMADAAAEIVALNGLADRVRVVAKASNNLDVEADMGGPVDVLVSEIVSNDMLAEDVLPAMEDAVGRLLKPGGRMIPASGRVRVALAHWAGLEGERVDKAAGFDISPLNGLQKAPHRVKSGDPRLSLHSAPADIFDFDFTSGGPYPTGRNSVILPGDGQPCNGVAQWIHLQLDEEIVYENRPAPGPNSCWAVLFHPFPAEMAAGRVRVWGSHDRRKVRIWAEPA